MAYELFYRTVSCMLSLRRNNATHALLNWSDVARARLGFLASTFLPMHNPVLWVFHTNPNINMTPIKLNKVTIVGVNNDDVKVIEITHDDPLHHQWLINTEIAYDNLIETLARDKYPYVYDTNAAYAPDSNVMGFFMRSYCPQVMEPVPFLLAPLVSANDFLTRIQNPFDVATIEFDSLSYNDLAPRLQTLFTTHNIELPIVSKHPFGQCDCEQL